MFVKIIVLLRYMVIMELGFFALAFWSTPLVIGATYFMVGLRSIIDSAHLVDKFYRRIHIIHSSVNSSMDERFYCSCHSPEDDKSTEFSSGGTLTVSKSWAIHLRVKIVKCNTATVVAELTTFVLRLSLQ